MFFRIGQVSQLLGVSITTLRRWDQDNSFSATHQTVGGIAGIALELFSIGRTGSRIRSQFLLNHRNPH